MKESRRGNETKTVASQLSKLHQQSKLFIKIDIKIAIIHAIKIILNDYLKTTN